MAQSSTNCLPVDNGNLELRAVALLPFLSHASTEAPFRSAIAGGIGLHERCVTDTWGCGRTMASFGAADAGRVLRQLGVEVLLEEGGAGGFRLRVPP